MSKMITVSPAARYLTTTLVKLGLVAPEDAQIARFAVDLKATGLGRDGVADALLVKVNLDGGGCWQGWVYRTEWPTNRTYDVVAVWGVGRNSNAYLSGASLRRAWKLRAK